MQKNKRGKLSLLEQSIVLMVSLLLICGVIAYIGVRFNRGVCVPVLQDADLETLSVEDPEIAVATLTDAGLEIQALRSGVTTVVAGDVILAHCTCYENGFVAEQLTGHYTGDGWVQGAVVAFLLGAFTILLIALCKQIRQAFYHYDTPLLAGLCLLAGLMLVLLTVQLLMPGHNTIENILSVLPSVLLIVTMPVLVAFALAMLISNISLLRHEGKTWRNLLGSVIGLLLSLSTWIILNNTNASGSLEQLHLHDMLVNFVSGIVLWTECKLAGIILCGVMAAKHQPVMDKDYILILGCKLSRKGGLTPLLRGRVDRALNFARAQQQATGSMPVLIPCGGKGKDELRSEAAAMREYLLEQGVPEQGILCEDRSENTWENIRNAKGMMQAGAKIAYATTNYHVFRAGVWAGRNGLPAEGMGSKTKWYYWPNAFMREYVALVTANLRHELAMIILIAIQSGLLAYLYH